MFKKKNFTIQSICSQRNSFLQLVSGRQIDIIKEEPHFYRFCFPFWLILILFDVIRYENLSDHLLKKLVG